MINQVKTKRVWVHLSVKHNGIEYYSPALLPYVGEIVIVGVNENKDSVNVHSQDGKFIGRAYTSEYLKRMKK